MLPKSTAITKLSLLTVFILIITSACQNEASHAPSTTSPAMGEPTATWEPTPTEPPMAIKINGDGITLDEFETEITRYQLAMEETGNPVEESEARQRALEELTGQLLLANAAHQAGYQADPALVEERIAELANSMGGEAALMDWMSGVGYTREQFQIALIRMIEAGWQRNQIIDQVAEMAEQIHARQILVGDSATAEQISRQLQAGSDFQNLAFQYDPLTGGDLGWFPRGYLTQPEIDEVVFTIQPGGFTPVIETDLGYHILYVIARENDRSLAPDARLRLQQKALGDWMDQQRQSVRIEVLAE